ncbi:hypothetical protein ACK3F5_19670 [Photorhabdus asymbiotica UENP]
MTGVSESSQQSSNLKDEGYINIGCILRATWRAFISSTIGH